MAIRFMAGLHQIQIRYEPLEDRALLRVATTDGSEFRFWVTRRYARLLWKALSGSAMPSTRAAIQPAPAAREAVMAFEKEAALARADFATDYVDQGREMPLGDAPILLARVRCARQDDGALLLALHPIEGQGIEVRLDDTLLHSLIKLLGDAARAGEWDLAFDTRATEAAPSGPLN